MLPSQTVNLPLEQQRRLHPDFVANEQAYLQMRDGLLPLYQGQWVAVDKGQVVAAGSELLDVMAKAAGSGGHPYVARVGMEEKTVFRVRRAEFAYDAGYQPTALPRSTVTFLNHAETRALTLPDVIPDTGADVSVLPDTDGRAIDLFQGPCLTSTTSGVVGGPVATLIYYAKAEVNGKRGPALIQAVAGLQERIVGRDVLNQYRVVFDGPQLRVTFEP